MNRCRNIYGWYHDTLARARARRLRLPVYPFAGTVKVLLRTTRLLRDPTYAALYCDSLPAHIFCHADTHTASWWILGEHMLWMAQIDLQTQGIAFACCVDFHSGDVEANKRMRDIVLPLYTSAMHTSISWEQRLVALANASERWM